MKKIIFFILLFIVFKVTAQYSYSLDLEKSTLKISGTSTVSDWTVTAEKFTCNLNIDSKKIANLELNVPVADIKSERGVAMDSKMHDALKNEEYPSINFVVKNQIQQSTLSGELTIAGVRKSVKLPIEFKIESEMVYLKGDKSLILKDYEIEPPSAMFGQIVVGEEVTVFFDLYFSSK